MTPDPIPLGRLRCLHCRTQSLEPGPDGLRCPCGAVFPVVEGVPSLLHGGPETQDWNAWDLDEVKMLASSYWKRATGELPEKEASKSYARLLRRRGIFRTGDAVLDLGCASGHFYRSLRDRLDPGVDYTGIDINAEFLVWGRRAYGDACAFVHGDCLDMPFPDRAFDLVLVNLFHFFPSIVEAMREALRVADRMVVWRTPVGVTNYAVKVIYDNDFSEIGDLTANRDDVHHTLYMLYSTTYIQGLVEHLGGRVAFVERDTDFEPFDNTALEEFCHVPSTKVVGDMQVNGNLVLDWHYIGIVPPGAVEGAS